MPESNVISTPTKFEWNDGPLGRVFSARRMSMVGGIELQLKGGNMALNNEPPGVVVAGFAMTPAATQDLIVGLQAWIEQL